MKRSKEMKFEAFFKKGLRRSEYQDFLEFGDLTLVEGELISGLSSSDIVVLCDGMGGLQDGDVASEFVAKEFAKLTTACSEISEDTIRTNVLATHDALIDFSRNRFGFTCMGSTLCALLTSDEYIWIVNVGDTRAYLAQGSRIQQVSVDDYLSPEENSVLTQCIGGRGGIIVRPHIVKIERSSDLEVALCTDGFYRAIEISLGFDCVSSMVTGMSNDDDATFVKVTF